MAVISRVVLGIVSHVVYDDVLTRDVVTSRKWHHAVISELVTTLSIEENGVMEIHQFPAVTPDRRKPLAKLLADQNISFSDHFNPQKAASTPAQHVPRTDRQKAEAKKKREDAMMAAAARVLEYKAKMAEKAAVSVKVEDDINDAFCLAESDREVDCW